MAKSSCTYRNRSCVCTLATNLVSKKLLLLIFVVSLLFSLANSRFLDGCCGNGIKDEEETCDDGNRINGDGCSSNCRVESNYKCIGTPSVCFKCGDGRLDQTEQCDDGNSQSEDGCSQNCRIEEGFQCNGSPSVCAKPTRTNQNAQGIISNNTQKVNDVCGDGRISGTEVCDDGNVINRDGCSDKCSIEPGYICDGEPLNCESVNNLGGAAATIGKTVLFTIIANIAVSIITSLSIEGSVLNFWATINILQLLQFVPMMTLYFPQVFLTMFSYISLVNMNNWILMEIFNLTINQNQITSQDGLDYRFNNQSYGSTNIFLNSGDTFTFLSIWILNIIIIYVLSSIFKPNRGDLDSKKKVKIFSITYAKRYLRDLRNSIFFNFFIRFGYEAYLGLGLSCLLNIYYPVTETFTEVESLIVSCILAAFL